MPRVSLWLLIDASPCLFFGFPLCRCSSIDEMKIVSHSQLVRLGRYCGLLMKWQH